MAFLEDKFMRMTLKSCIGLILAVGVLLYTAGDSQTTCSTPPTNASTSSDGHQYALPANTQVDVYFDTSQFDSADITAMEQAFQGWQNNDAISGVTFNFIQLAGPPPATGTFITVSQSSTLDPSSAMETSTVNINNGTYDTVNNASITVNSSLINDPSMEQKMAHEIGHLMGLGDCGSCALGSSVMAFGDGLNSANGADTPTTCDVNESNNTFPPYKANKPSGGGGGSFCPPGFRPNQDGGCDPSPIIVDVDGSGISLTDAINGVSFDIFNIGFSVHVAWTASGSSNAFLVLDRNGDGMITSGAELFGNFTPQPASNQPNGFTALAEFDKPENGGNGDGVIDANDAIFSKLKLWQDKNHNGISEPDELHTLPELGIDSISLDFHLSPRTDEFGNQFRFRSKIDDQAHSHGARWAWDVFFVWN
jgi:hypothetical protein